jgi:hypothetical protein
MESFLAYIVFACLGLVLYTYLGYPLLVLSGPGRSGEAPELCRRFPWSWQRAMKKRIFAAASSN